MPQENIENFLAGPENEWRVGEAYEATKNGFADQELQVRVAGTYTARTARQRGKASPRVQTTT